jgi:hypothetical protein
VFVLREVFGFSHAEVAETLGRSEATVRQLAHRAREHVEARRPRFAADARTRREVTERFTRGDLTGDVEALMATLAPGVTLVTDGGGRVKAAVAADRRRAQGGRVPLGGRVGRADGVRPAARARRRQRRARRRRPLRRAGSSSSCRSTSVRRV